MRKEVFFMLHVMSDTLSPHVPLPEEKARQVPL